MNTDSMPKRISAKPARLAALILIVSLVLSCVTGCSAWNHGSGSEISDGSAGSGLPLTDGGSAGVVVPVAGDKIEPSDYSKKSNWMLLPKQNDKPVDVFYLYPTSWGIKHSSDYPVSSVDLKRMRSGARGNASKQASAFKEVGNLYAPYYRQVAVAFVLNQPQEQRAQYFGGIPAADTIAAFDYYIRHYNNGRPYILVGHSQGAAVIKELLFTYMKEHPDVYSRMVAAYVIGYSVTGQELEDHPWLTFAEGAEDTGVIISYNTEAPVIGGTNNTVIPGALAINPISWTRGEVPAPAEENPGSYVKIDGRMTMVKGLADAAVDSERGTVICSSVDPEQFKGKNAKYFPSGVYHSFDIAFYYTSLGQNAALRTDSFLLKQSQGSN